MATKIHPTAVVDAAARLGQDVSVGPYAIIEADVTVGDRCELMAGAILHRYTSLGPDNRVGPYCVLGGMPQDFKFDPAGQTFLRIGAGNVFREYVTLSRATADRGATVIGDGCFFMTQSHVGHDCTIGDGAILTNNAAVAGHCEIGSGAFLSANTLVHQYCWVGELSMMRGAVGVSMHVPPFVMVMATNYIAGLNVVGLRRAEHITDEDRRQIKEGYRLLYRAALTPEKALARMDACDDWAAPAGRFRDFVRRVIEAEPPFNRGLVTASAAQRPGG